MNPTTRMLAALALTLTAACSGHTSSGDDASGDHPPNNQPCAPAPAPLCSSTCGNNVIDLCAVENPHMDVKCAGYSTHNEVCDGTDAPGCTSKGYYGGTGACSTNCMTFSPAGCTACASGPQIADCDALEGASTAFVTGLAVNETAQGALLALAHYSGNPPFEIISADSLAQVSTQSFVGREDAIATVPGGWLLADIGAGTAVRHLDTAGVFTAASTIWQGSAFGGVGLAYGAGNRALLAWPEWDASAMTSAVWLALLDETGSVVVAPTKILAATMLTGGVPEQIQVATDGSSFFVATTRDYSLRRIGIDGTVISTTTMSSPAARLSRLLWSGTAGWWVSYTNNRLLAQRFDGNGAMVGNIITATTTGAIDDVIARGDELVVLQGSPTSTMGVTRLEVERVDTAGNITTPIEIGVGDPFSARYIEPRLASVGATIAVAWYGAYRYQVALVTP